MTAPTKILFGLFGTGGCGRSIMPFARPFIREKFAAESAEAECVFVQTSPTASEVNGVRVVSEEAFFRLEGQRKYFNVAIADAKIRAALAAKCAASGILPLSLAASNVVTYDHNEIGAGAILHPFSMITTNVKIGAFFHANIYSYVEHDCVIGDYVTFAPRVNCNGNVHIGDRVYVGTNAVIRQGANEKPLVIGEGAVIGMGAVVTKDVAPYTTVVGNPARPLEG